MVSKIIIITILILVFSCFSVKILLVSFSLHYPSLFTNILMVLFMMFFFLYMCMACLAN
uniref:Uncharacterized protein n=1 Tax=Octopus bimaculoides TaxID=37653 RepID=A0A0L8G9T7_OCTBM